MQVFEDEGTAAEYCSVLEGEGQECLGIAQVEAKEVRKGWEGGNKVRKGESMKG